MNSIEARLERLRKRLEAPKLKALAKQEQAAAKQEKADAARRFQVHLAKQRRKAQWGVFWRRCRRKGWPVPVSHHREEQDWSKELLDAEKAKAETKAASYTRGPYNKRPAWATKKHDATREQAEWLEDKVAEEAREAAADAKFQQDLRDLQERQARRYNAA